ncbi:MAG TPA: hypothetical protein VLE97_09745 [Gaiellaceae bacterium]|nr:hypothetical protein [Gaiellaceae bacterium]
MTSRDHAWEFCVGALSWFVAVGALVLVVAFLAFEAYRGRRRR